jgi:glycosyltransferase involved in cell wall biosynthesis
MPVASLPVSVVIPAYNAEATLGMALASVSAQSFLPQSVIVVDDGSRDDTATVVDRWRGLLPIEVVRNRENQGPASARRQGVAASTAPLIALLDADDVWLPDHLDLMSSSYARSPGLVSADALRWVPSEGISKRRYRQLAPIPPPETQRLEILRRNFVFTGVLFSMERYEAAGGFNERLRAAEDWDLWIRMVRGGDVVTGTASPSVLYRLSRTSLSADDRTLAAEIEMLTGVLADAGSNAERRALNQTMSRLQCRHHLELAYRNARDKELPAARREALRALRGTRLVALRAAAMCIAPGLGLRFRDARKWQPEGWLNR